MVAGNHVTATYYICYVFHYIKLKNVLNS